MGGNSTALCILIQKMFLSALTHILNPENDFHPNRTQGEGDYYTQVFRRGDSLIKIRSSWYGVLSAYPCGEHTLSRFKVEKDIFQEGWRWMMQSMRRRWRRFTQVGVNIYSTQKEIVVLHAKDCLPLILQNPLNRSGGGCLYKKGYPFYGACCSAGKWMKISLRLSTINICKIHSERESSLTPI